jgi:hypothetical protein
VDLPAPAPAADASEHVDAGKPKAKAFVYGFIFYREPVAEEPKVEAFYYRFTFYDLARSRRL